MIKEHKFEFILTLLIIIIAVIGIIIAIKNNNLSNQALDNFKIILYRKKAWIHKTINLKIFNV